MKFVHPKKELEQKMSNKISQHQHRQQRNLSGNNGSTTLDETFILIRKNVVNIKDLGYDSQALKKQRWNV